MITAAMLYDQVMCPHRPSMDLFANPMKRDKLSPFVKLLWEKGTAYEEEVIASLDIPFLDLTPYSLEEKESKTLEAIEKKEDIRHFRTTAACLTDAIATLIREKEEVVHAEQWRKNQDEVKAKMVEEQERKEEIALAMQHGMEGR